MDLNSVLLIIIMRAMIRLKSIEILVKSTEVSSESVHTVLELVTP